MTKKRTGTPWMTPTEYGRTLTGLSMNLIVRDISKSLPSYRDVLGFSVHYADVVVSADIRNRLADDVMVVPIFSQGAEGPTHVHIERGVGGLRRDGVLFCEELTTLDRDVLSRGPWGPAVPGEVLTAVIRGVRRALGETVTGPS